MNFRKQYGPGTAAALLASVIGLNGCGGDDPPQLPAKANADSATLAWNSAADLNLTGNDLSPGGGALSVAEVGQPAHGSATLSAGKVRYTPAAGYYGPDSFSYAIADGIGGRSSAMVSLTVEARSTLKGRAFDAPLQQATVTVKIGDQTFTTTTDADGNYSLPVTYSQPAQFVSVTAQGTGAQAQVKLVSLVGEAAALAKATGSDGSAPASSTPALNVTHVSTAMAALATAANGGSTPTTQTALEKANAEVGAAELLQMAAAIKLVADGGVPLPAGAADTAALVASPATYNTFVTAQTLNNAAALQAAQNATLNDPALMVPAAASVSSSTRRVYYIGKGCCTGGVRDITLNPDGTAKVDGTSATWQSSAGAIRISYAVPTESQGWSDRLFNGMQVATTDTTTGLVIRQLTGTASSGVVAIGYIGKSHYNGNEAPDEAYDETGYTYVFNDEAKLVAPTAAELASSTFAGIPLPTYGQGAYSQDILQLNSDGTGRMQIAGLPLRWSLTGERLVLTYESGTQQRIARLARAGDGEERWLVRYFVPGTNGELIDDGALDAMVVKVDAGLSFGTGEAVASWQSYTNAGITTSSTFFNYDKDGHLSLMTAYLDGTSESSYWGDWQVIDGKLVTRGYFMPGNDLVGTCPEGASCTLRRERSWTKLATSGSKVFVMEHLWYLNSLDQWRINRYETGTGPKPQGAYVYLPLNGGKKAARAQPAGASAR